MSRVLPAADPAAEELVGRVADEFLDRLDRGEQPAIEEYAAQHPEVAELLRRALPALLALRQSTGGAAPTEGLAGMLGDYRILREVGRGGMGIVYEAEQVSLGRRVALKVLPFASALDSKQLQRFQNEARAAAHLHHQNIVPVYNVGTERGVHYYAMQFIDGRTLAAMIAGLRPSPTTLAETTNTSFTIQPNPPAPVPILAPGSRGPEHYRTVARLGIQAAEALEHAHQHGVVHRDVKPANILLDQRGNLWVTDFGLARFRQDAQLTVTGDLLGTLRYMSPEQARATRSLVDHRTDVYSLGVTLYELLTLRPAYDGEDRPQILSQVAFTDPPAPSRFDPNVPRDLETVVLKAMAKEPTQRYQSAQELADDLQRFLDDLPVVARRPTIWQRLAKWAWRHRPLVLTVAVSLLTLILLAFAGLAVGYVRVSHEKELARSAAADATAAEAKEAAERRRAQRSLYAQSIARADLEWQSGNVARAAEILDGCAEEFRDWEWGYLRRLCQGALFTLTGHTDQINAVAFHPDGRRLVSGSMDHTVRVWDVEAGRELYRLPTREAVRCVAVSADGRLFAAGGGDWEAQRPAELKIWDAASGALLLDLPCGTGTVWGVSLSPDGKHLAASCVAPAELRVFETATGKLVHRIAAPSPLAVAYSPDGGKIAVGNHNGILQVFDSQTGQEDYVLGKHPSDIRAVTWDDAGRRLAAACFDGSVRQWAIPAKRESWTITGQRLPVHGLSYSPNGHFLASVSNDGVIRVWTAMYGREALTLRGHTREVISVAFSPGGRCLASASWDRTIKIWDVTRQQEGLVLQTPTGRNHAVAFDREGRRVLVAGSPPRDRRLPSYLSAWDVESGRLTQSLLEPPGAGAASAYVAPPGPLPGESGATKTPYLLPLGNVGPVRKDDGYEGHTSLAVHPDGRTVAVNWNARIRLWDLVGRKVVHNLEGHAGRVQAVAFDAEGDALASAGEDGTVRLWAWEDRTKAPVVRQTLTGHRGAVHAVAFPLSGGPLVSGGADGTVRLWDAESGRLLRTLNGHDGAVLSVGFAPDGSAVVSGGTDQTVRVWEAETGDVRHTLRGHTGSVTAVAWHPCSARLASAGEDGSVRIWETTTGEELLTLRRQVVHATALAWDRDGRRLAATQLRDYARIWKGEEPKTVDRVEAVLAWRELEAAGLIGRRQWTAARSHLLELAAARPDSPRYPARLTQVYTEMGQWEEAMAAARRAVGRGADLLDFEEGGRHVAWMHVVFGTPEEARATAAVLLDAVASSNPPAIAWEAVRLACLNPQACIDPVTAVKEAHEIVKHYRESPITLEVLALAQYRAGDWAGAVETCEKNLKGREALVTPWFVLAMAQHRRGETEAARRSLAKGVEAEKAAARLDIRPPSREERRRLRVEAEALLGVAHGGACEH